MWNQSKYSNFNKDFQVTESFKMHQDQLKKIKSSSRIMIDNSSPVKPKFLDFPLKLREYNVIKQLDYAIENKKLFQKIETINKKQSVDKICDNIKKQEQNLRSISNLTKRYSQIKTISEENDKLYQRIKQTQPVINKKEFMKQEMMTTAYKDMLRVNRRITNPMLNQNEGGHKRSSSNRMVDSRSQMNTLLIRRGGEEEKDNPRDTEFKQKLEQEYQKYQQKLEEIKRENEGKNGLKRKSKVDEQRMSIQEDSKEYLSNNQSPQNYQQLQKVQKDKEKEKEKDQELYLHEQFLKSQQKNSKYASQQNIEQEVHTENSVHRKNEQKLEETNKEEKDLTKQQYIDI